MVKFLPVHRAISSCLYFLLPCVFQKRAISFILFIGLAMAYSPLNAQCPTVQASGFTRTAEGIVSATISWTRGDGSNVIVVARANAAVTSNPVNGTAYTASAAYGTAGAQLGATGNYVVYSGTGTSVTVTSLTGINSYYFAIYEFNTSPSICYLTPALTNFIWCRPGTPNGYFGAGQNGRITNFKITNTATSAILLDNSATAATVAPNLGWDPQTTGSVPIPNLVQGTQYTFSMTRATDASSNYNTVYFIDFNKDGAFGGAPDYTNNLGAVTNVPTRTFNYTIPTTGISTGIVRLRIRNRNSTNTVACALTASTYGESEDYYVNIVPTCTPPTTQASSSPTAFAATPGFTNVNITNFTRGDGDSVLIIARATATAAVLPNGVYNTVSSVFNNGQSTTGTGNYVVFNGAWVSGTTTLNVTGLASGVSYTFDVYEVKTAGNCYKTPAFSNVVITQSCTPPTATTTVTPGGASNVQMDVSWSGGGGANTLVAVRSGSATAPTNGVAYTGATGSAIAYSAGQTLGTGKIVYNGSGNSGSVTVTGLTPNISYTFDVYSYNTGPECYAASTSGTLSTTNAMAYVSSTTTQNNATVNPSTTSQQIAGLEIVTAGATTPLSLTSITFNTTGSDNPGGDIANAKLYKGPTPFATGTATLLATISNPNGLYTINASSTPVLAAQTLSTGTNYFWLTYDIKALPTSTQYNNVKAAITGIEINSVSPTPGLSSTATATRQIVLSYCSPTGNTNLAGNGYVTQFKIADPSSNVLIDRTASSQSSCCQYIDNTGVGTPVLSQGITYSFSGKRQCFDGGFNWNYGINIWIDFNDDGTFDNSGGSTERIFSFISNTDPYSFSYQIPTTGISTGTHRLRIRTHYNDGNPDPCGNLGSGAQAMDFQVNIAPSTVTWTGATNNGWDTASNWSPQMVPNSCAMEVIINSGTPVISAANISVSDITLGSGATLTLNGRDLNVCGTWTGSSNATQAAVVGSGTTYINNSSGAQTIEGYTKFDILQVNNAAGVTLASGAQVAINTGLHLQAGVLHVTGGTLRLLSTAANHNSYMDNFTSGYGGSIDGDITADRYVPIVGYNQHFISSPVSTPALSQLNASGPDGSFVTPSADCDETKSAAGTPYGSVFTYADGHMAEGSCMLGNWRITSAGNMANGKGYSAYLNGNSIISLTGTANTDDMSIGGLNNSGYDSVQTKQGQWIESGWNLVGNPYPSAINLTNARTGSNFQNQVQVWRTSGPFAGSWQSAVIGQTPNIVIPPFQAFMVRASGNVGSHSYPFRQDERVRHTTQPFYRDVNANSLTLEVDYNGVKDMTRIAFNPAATTRFDDAFDANKYNGKAGRPTLYTTMSSPKWYSINTLPLLTETTTVPVGLRPEVSGLMVISPQGIETFDPTTYIILEDTKTGTMHNLRNGGYTFTATKDDAPNRFILHFTPPAQILSSDANCDMPGQIDIAQPGNTTWNYTLTDAANTAAISQGVVNQYSPVSVSVAAGSYLLTLTDNTGYAVVKNIQVAGLQPVSAVFTSSANSALTEEDITFSSTSGDIAASNNWDFGDGTRATGQTATHSYLHDGVYTVSLAVANAEGCSSASNRTVTITSRNTTTGIEELNNKDIKIWSNDNLVLVDFSKQGSVEAEIEIFNVLGQLLYREKFGKSTIYSREIDNAGAAYVIVKVKNNNEVATSKLFIASK